MSIIGDSLSYVLTIMLYTGLTIFHLGLIACLTQLHTILLTQESIRT